MLRGGGPGVYVGQQRNQVSSFYLIFQCFNGLIITLPLSVGRPIATKCSCVVEHPASKSSYVFGFASTKPIVDKVVLALEQKFSK